MLTNPTTWYAGSRYVRVDQRGVKRDVLVPFHQPAQDAVGILADHERSRRSAPPIAWSTTLPSPKAKDGLRAANLLTMTLQINRR